MQSTTLFACPKFGVHYKLEDRQRNQGADRSVISIASWKIRKFNEHLFKRFSSYLGLDFSLIKANPEFENLCNYGSITA
ncbi:hypothetical protein BN874_2020001 [Candidatus Contendobacter odensis Run_B_J11]|uniref:Uncharacterized protein n=1 Tax=Candidatus Contendobacter odensis Run_B_J11 TaxID=1400861 RepID=A0A7U7GB78_9GAMM|nr:hypothetical protein BN874_2020001 [Candidatus Contendobacter odensis Run_B_J11]